VTIILTCADSVLAAWQRLMATGRVVALDLACPWRPAENDESRGIRAQLLSRLCNLAR
jgi:arginase